MEACRIFGISILGAGIGICLSLLVGMALLETAFSLPFAVVLGVVLFVLGVLLLVNMSLSAKASSKANSTNESKFARCSSLTIEIAVLSIIAFLTIAGGAFAIWLYLKSTALPAAGRVFMYIVLGASVTVILSVNLLDLIELTLRWCHSWRAKRKEAAELEKQKGQGPIKLGGSGASTSSAATYSIATGQKRLFPLRAQNWLIIFVALVSGLYYGYCYGSIAAKQLEVAQPGATFDPVPVVIRYLTFTVPVAGVGGFVVTAIALLLPHFVSGGGGPNAAGSIFQKLSGTGKKASSSSGGDLESAGSKAPLLSSSSNGSSSTGPSRRLPSSSATK